MRRFQILKEAFVATSIIVTITFLISSLPLKNEFLKGIRQDVNGFDIYDLTFNDSKKINKRDTNIIIIQVDDTRNNIAEQIRLIESYEPAIVGVDVFFEKEKDSINDTGLLEVAATYKNLVFGNMLNEVNEEEELQRANSFFEKNNNGSHSGYMNFVGNELAVVRNYPPFYTVNKKQIPSFTSKIIEQYSAEIYANLKKKKTKQAVINYSGNAPDTYTSISKEELLEYHETGQLAKLIKNKIVLLGYFVKYPPYVMEDLKFSPLNKTIAGKSFPDMYGVVIHANILTMIIENKFAVMASDVFSYFVAFFVTFLFLWYIMKPHTEKSHPSHAKILILQLLLILFSIYIFVQIFDLFLFKTPLTPLVISLVLCVELLGLYKIIALWLHKKFGYITIFNKKHSI